jgi:hypothetical protein
MSIMLRKRWRLLKMFLCFKVLTKSLKMYDQSLKTGTEIIYVTGRNLMSQDETFSQGGWLWRGLIISRGIDRLLK